MGTESTSCELCGARRNSVFCSLHVGQLEEIDGLKKINHLKKGDALFSVGQYSRGLFCINAGHLKLVRYGHDGREQILRFAGPGDTLGYASMISGATYSLEALAVEDATVCFVPTETVQRYLRENPHLTLNVMQLMSHEIEDMEKRVVELAQKSVRERVAEALLVLRETFGTEEDGETLNVPLTREEIADIVGTAPESLIRMLSELKSQSIIETHGRRIKVKDVKALIEVANLTD
jgi:CRP/FNR family transcriptional regulator, polysaccharide utilization system transcription regulator